MIQLRGSACVTVAFKGVAKKLAGISPTLSIRELVGDQLTRIYSKITRQNYSKDTNFPASVLFIKMRTANPSLTGDHGEPWGTW